MIAIFAFVLQAAIAFMSTTAAGAPACTTPFPQIQDSKMNLCLDCLRNQAYWRNHRNDPVTTCSGTKMPSATFTKTVFPPSLKNTCLAGNLNLLKAGLTRQLDQCRASLLSLPPLVLPVSGRKSIIKVTPQKWCIDSNKRLLELVDATIAAKGTIEDFYKAAQNQFDWYQTNNAAGSAPDKCLYTSYYTRALECSTTPSANYTYPIFQRPNDLVKVKDVTGDPKANLCGVYDIACPGSPTATNINFGVCRKLVANGNTSYVPYYTRHELETAFKNNGSKDVLFYVKDPIVGSSLMVEGSGVCQFPDKSEKAYAVAATNGRPNNMLSRVIRCYNQCGVTVPGWPTRNCSASIDRAQGSEEGQEDYFREMNRCSPHTVDPLRDYDQSFVFFSEKPNGPTGNDEIVLTPDVSVASDPDIYPGGSLLLISGQSFVDAKKCGKKAETTLSIAQDTGGYIKACHLDRYAGAGAAAKNKAAAYKFYGPIYVAVVKGGSPDEKVVCR